MTQKQKRAIAKRRRHGKTAIGAAVALGAVGVASTGAQAADITVANTGDSGPGSLREAIESANATPASDQILFQSGLSGEITLASALPALTSPVQVKGPGKDTLAVDGADLFRIFHAKADATISGLTLKDGFWDTPLCAYPYDNCGLYGGGALAVEAGKDVTVNGVAFADSYADRVGGAIYSQGGSGLTVEDCTFTGNSSTMQGGAIFVRGGGYSESSELHVSGSAFSGNSTSFANGSGGAISGGGSLISLISGSTFESNSSEDGGALRLSSYGGGSAAISGSTFTGNTAAVGAAARLTGRFEVQDSTFTANLADHSGGALMLFPSASSTVSGSTFTQNKTGQAPPAVYADNGGGAIVLSGNARIRLRNLTIAENVANGGEGGGILSFNGSTELDSVTVVGNSVTVNPLITTPAVGGGIYQANGTLELNNSIVSGNTSPSRADLAGAPAVPGGYGSPAGEFDVSFSLIGDNSGAPINETVPGSNLNGVDPQLGTLADNGGPTPTMLPADSSPVINKGRSNLTSDQRGLTRPVDFAAIPFSAAVGANGADMGAVELQYTPPVPTPARIKGVSVSGPGSIRVGKVSIYKVRITNGGEMEATGVRLKVTGRGIAFNTAVGRITGSTSRTVRVRVRPRRPGRIKATFEVTSTNAGSRSTSRKITVRKSRK